MTLFKKITRTVSNAQPIISLKPAACFVNEHCYRTYSIPLQNMITQIINYVWGDLHLRHKNKERLNLNSPWGLFRHVFH